jgi:hypothetical protein
MQAEAQVRRGNQRAAIRITDPPIGVHVARLCLDVRVAKGRESCKSCFPGCRGGYSRRAAAAAGGGVTIMMIVGKRAG